MRNFKCKELLFVSVLLIILCLVGVMAVEPYGAGAVTEGTSTSAPADSPANATALAGNVTELVITGYSNTQVWQGYYGNVSGTIQLADAQDHVMYNWSVTDPEGEVYASTADSITWADIACYDVDTDALGLEAAYGLVSDDVDGLNETFLTKNHDEFFTNNIQFEADDCDSVQLYDSTNGSTDGRFEEVILWDTAAAIFTSILEDTAQNGFDGADHDFEMLVLDDGHGTDTDETTYYFYVELEG